jgi:predicted amidophosphoribosyltransferase
MPTCTICGEEHSSGDALCSACMVRQVTHPQFYCLLCQSPHTGRYALYCPKCRERSEGAPVYNAVDLENPAEQTNAAPAQAIWGGLQGFQPELDEPTICAACNERDPLPGSFWCAQCTNKFAQQTYFNGPRRNQWDHLREALDQEEDQDLELQTPASQVRP